MVVASLALLECSAYQPKSVCCHIQIDKEVWTAEITWNLIFLVRDKPHLKVVWMRVKSDLSPDSLVASIRFFKLSFAPLAAWHTITLSNPERQNGQPNHAAQRLCSMIVWTWKLLLHTELLRPMSLPQQPMWIQYAGDVWTQKSDDLITCKKQCGHGIFQIWFERQIGFACCLNIALVFAQWHHSCLDYWCLMSLFHVPQDRLICLPACLPAIPASQQLRLCHLFLTSTIPSA